jgi:hypothetical protein
MTGHGYLYGTNSGISLTVSIWTEMVGERLRTLLWAPPSYVRVPRALVAAALRNKQSQSPSMRAAIRNEQATWDAFSEAHLDWRLRHVRVLESPALAATRDRWVDRYNAAERELDVATAALCRVNIGRACAAAKQRHVDLVDTVSHLRHLANVWRALFRGEEVSARDLTTSTVKLTEFYANLTRFHDVRSHQDVRVVTALSWAATGSRPLVVASLLEGEVWRACLEHTGVRQNRLMELALATGFGDHERAMNASLLGIMGDKEQMLVREWFGEIAGYGWVLSATDAEVPAIVRRCVTQEAGECRRITPVEIVAMEQHMVWSSRLIAGMWSAMPVILLLFVIELASVCVVFRSPIRQYKISDVANDAIVSSR